MKKRKKINTTTKKIKKHHKAKIVTKKKSGTKKVLKPKKQKQEPLNKIWLEVILKDPQLRRWVVREIGEHAIEVINAMNKELSDEDLAKKTNLKPSEVRVVLNRLHAHGLAVYSRKRDKDSGWYNYIWQLNKENATQLYEGFKKIQQETLQQGQKGEFYYCIVNGEKKIYTFEQALQNNFRCPISGQPLKYLEKKIN
jgi:transcription initiation factor TFIIE subunit alpha